jgi:hypothetical protein
VFLGGVLELFSSPSEARSPLLSGSVGIYIREDSISFEFQIVYMIQCDNLLCARRSPEPFEEDLDGDDQ